MDFVPVIAVIRELLLNGKPVTVPGLGTFEVRYHPAQILSESGYLLPPSGKAVLDPDRSADDGFLEEQIAEQLGYPKEESRRIVDAFCEAIRAQLAGKEPLLFEGIGTITADHKGRVSFVPAAGLSFLPDAYGLTPFRMEGIRRAGK